MFDYYLVAFMVDVGFDLVFHRSCSTLVASSDKDDDPQIFWRRIQRF